MRLRLTRGRVVWCLPAFLATAIGLGIADPARAQPALPPAQKASPQDAAAFEAENKRAMDRMMLDMEVKPTGDISRDFVAMMRPHHQGAIDMAQAYLRHGRDEVLRRIAQEIIVEQQQEIIAMNLAVGEPLLASAPAPTQLTPSTSTAADVPAPNSHHHHATNR